MSPVHLDFFCVTGMKALTTQNLYILLELASYFFILFYKRRNLFAKLVKPNLCLLHGLLVCSYNWNIQAFIFYQIIWFALELVIQVWAFFGTCISLTTGTIIITTGLNLTNHCCSDIKNWRHLYSGEREDSVGGGGADEGGVQLER